MADVMVNIASGLWIVLGVIYKCFGVCPHFKSNTKINLYDKCEVIEGCTVEILTNTLTGETSVGWWRGGVEDRPGMEEYD